MYSPPSTPPAARPPVSWLPARLVAPAPPDLGPDGTLAPRLDALGIFYVALAGSWTLLVALALAALWAHHRLPFLRMRALGLTCAATALLHCYWVTAVVGYPLAGALPEQAQFWLMGLLLPFGIGLFHAGNGMFLHVARRQRRWLVRPDEEGQAAEEKRAEGPAGGVAAEPGRWAWARRIRGLEYQNKMLVLVSAGMVLQILLTVAMFTASRKFHIGFGIAGTEVSGTAWQRSQEQRQGWEW